MMWRWERVWLVVGERLQTAHSNMRLQYRRSSD